MAKEETSKAKELIFKNFGAKSFLYNSGLFELILKTILEFGEWQDNQNTQNDKSKIQEEIIKEFCNENLTTHTDHYGTWVETKNICSSVDEFAKKLMQHIEDNHGKC